MMYGIFYSYSFGRIMRSERIRIVKVKPAQHCWDKHLFRFWNGTVNRASAVSCVSGSNFLLYKAEHLYSALHGIQTTLKRSGMDHTVLPATNTMPALPCKRSSDGATTDWGGGHLIAAYCSFIDPERMKGWVGLVGWPAADGLPT